MSMPWFKKGETIRVKNNKYLVLAKDIGGFYHVCDLSEGVSEEDRIVRICWNFKNFTKVSECAADRYVSNKGANNEKNKRI